MCRWSGSAAARGSCKSIRCRGCRLRVRTMQLAISVTCTAVILVVAASASGRDLALIEAVRDGDRAAARALVEKQVDVNVASADGSTALHWAAYGDNLELADLLIRAG